MATKPLRLLVVDDDECDRLAMRRTLAQVTPGAEIVDAAAAASGLALLASQSFDGAFIDYRLPDGDGLNLLLAARAAGTGTPFVLLTGQGNEELAVEALQQGAVDYLVKSALTAERLAKSLERMRSPANAPTDLPPVHRHMARAIENAAESVMITDVDGHIRYVNAAFSVLTGYSAAEVIGRKPAFLKSGRTSTALYHELWSTITDGRVWRGDLTNRCRNGSLVDTEVTISPVFDDARRIDGFVATHRDVSVERRTARELELMASTDGLTGLFNRRHLDKRLTEELARARRYQRPLCLMLIDLDHFKQINDQYGHLTGDEVLVGSARLIRETIRVADTAIRYGGEEFCILLPETSLRKARHLAERIRERVGARSYRVPQGKLRVTCSVGVAAVEEGTGAEQLLRSADEALYAAKTGGRNRVEVAC